jgi:hypothetical protein
MKIEHKMHEESWSFRIEREEGDGGWPDSYKAPHVAQLLRPDGISVVIRRGDKSPSLVVHGANILKDGGAGARRSVHIYAFNEGRAANQWLGPLARQARHMLKLGPDTTGCGW